MKPGCAAQSMRPAALMTAAPSWMRCRCVAGLRLPCVVRPASVIGRPAGARRVVASCVPGPFHPCPSRRRCRRPNVRGADVNQAWCRTARSRGQTFLRSDKAKALPARSGCVEPVGSALQPADSYGLFCSVWNRVQAERHRFPGVFCTDVVQPLFTPVRSSKSWRGRKKVMNDRCPDHSKRRIERGRTTLAWCLLATWLVASGGVLFEHMKNNPAGVCVTRN